MAPRAVYLVAGAVAAVVLTTMVAFWDCPHSSAFACVSVEAGGGGDRVDAYARTRGVLCEAYVLR